MQLSIVIVNYNVRYFLEHCLRSVSRACANLQAEIIVVDNRSTDGSVEMVMEKFPDVILIANQENTGFARANNQGVGKASGEYILYLNPDTIVAEDCFEKCLAYMDAHPTAGALGCRLIDGKGQFLPESKRGFPSADVAFYKITGLNSLFKTSKTFNRYHLGYLSEHEVNEVDVLVGCFMLCRKKIIDQVGGFDETYFMYGEDIDLSYKIIQAGYKNIYFPETTVIHYKGESTKKGSLNYVKMFYQAMIIFAEKHFKGSRKGLFVFMIRLSIYLRAVLAFVTRMFSMIKLPLIDAGILFVALSSMKTVWIQNVKAGVHYSHQLLVGFFSLYVLIWVFSIYLNGGYDKPFKAMRLMRGMLVGAIISLALYGLLPETLRFSRGITVLGAVVGTLMILLSRKVMQYLKFESVAPDDFTGQSVMVVGTADEEKEIRSLLDQAYIQKNIIGTVSPFEQKESHQLGILRDIKPLSQLYHTTEIIFAQHHLDFARIIQAMQDCGPTVQYKIHGMGTDSIIGSNSKNTAGDLYSTELIYQITTAHAKRNKRLVDMVASILFLLVSPILFWFSKKKSTYFLHHLLVLEGDKTYVGYTDPQFPKL
ncbi:MAG TPA: glycosyltransferase, partial [Chitinophagaceae bacterium]|nr:glycosyltransferase [Chitinophagaceae bacterium]